MVSRTNRGRSRAPRHNRNQERSVNHETEHHGSQQKDEYEEGGVECANQEVWYDDRQISSEPQRNNRPHISDFTKNQKRPGGRAANACSLTEAAARFSAQGKYAAAEERLLEAAELLRRAGASSRERAVVCNELGMVCKYLGRFRSAKRYYQQALCSMRYLTSADPFIADLYHNLGGLEHSRRRFRQAEEYARKGLRLRMQLSVDNSPAVASDLKALGAILDGLGKHDESEKLYHRAWSIYRKQFGSVHAEIAVVLNNLGAMHQSAGRHGRAAYFYRFALSMKRRVLNRSHPGLVPTMNNLATLLLRAGRVVDARHWLRRALRLAGISLGRSHPLTRTLVRNFDRISSYD
jgi:tetratricopeptide (TPR) repeat protein